MNGIVGNLPKLVQPKSGELYAQWVDQEWNLWAGCNGGYNKAPYNAKQTNHWKWLFESINALQKDDICFFGGDYIIFAWGSDAAGYYKEGIYTGLQQAMRNAMARGAKVLALTDRYYTGGRDGSGYSVSCQKKGTPWGFGKSKDCSRSGIYCGPSDPAAGNSSWCSGITMGQNNFDPTQSSSLASYAEYLKNNKQTATYNYFAYDMPGENQNLDNASMAHPHCHVKLISFYYQSTNRFSVFKGAWNMSTWAQADSLKETGMGFTGLLDDPVGQLMAWGDLGHLRALENNSIEPFYIYIPKGKTQQEWYGSDIDPVHVSIWFKKNFINSDIPPPQPLTIPTLYFMGPSFGTNNKLFGCGAVNSGRMPNYSCNNTTEDWIKITEYNVNLCLGYDPMPQGKCTKADKLAGKGILAPPPNDCWNTFSIGTNNNNWQKANNNWYALSDPDSFDPMGGGTPQSGFPWGMDLIVTLINNSTYMKTMMHSQLIGTGNDSTTSGAVPIFYQTILDFGKKHNWYTVTNPDINDVRNNQSSIGYILNSRGNNWFPRFYQACGSAFTHDKLWISDVGFILASGHPQMMHYNQFLTNCELLLSNCPTLTAYMNNHFNSIYAVMEPAPFGKSGANSIPVPYTCPNSQQSGICSGPAASQIIAPRQGWESFINMPQPQHTTPPPHHHTTPPPHHHTTPPPHHHTTPPPHHHTTPPPHHHTTSPPGPITYNCDSSNRTCISVVGSEGTYPNIQACQEKCSKIPWLLIAFLICTVILFIVLSIWLIILFKKRVGRKYNKI